MAKDILIIDDSEIIRDRLAISLAEIPNVHIVGQASNTAEGYDLFMTCNPEIIILDIRMPGESGIKLLERIKRESPQTTVIILTNYPYQAYRQHCEKLGANFFLDKSTEFEKIAELI